MNTMRSLSKFDHTDTGLRNTDRYGNPIDDRLRVRIFGV